MTRRKKIQTAAWLALAALAVGVPLALLAPALATHFTTPTPLWGYEADFANADMLQYDVGTDMFVTSCVPAGGAVPPNAFGNGRGVALDPGDGNLWYSVLNQTMPFPGFSGDGLIHKATLPPVCTELAPIPFGDGAGGTVQDDIGAIDIDPDDGDLWVAGYSPCDAAGTTCGFFAGNTHQHLYKVDSGTGAILKQCTVTPLAGNEGNDTLAVAKLSGLPGSGKYLLTDAGEFSDPTLQVVDEASCTGVAPGTVVTTFTMVTGTTPGVTGLDFEGNKLIASTLSNIISFGSPPYPPVLLVATTMLATPSTTIEDITLKTGPVLKPTIGKVTMGGFILGTAGPNVGGSPASINNKATFGGVVHHKSGDANPKGELMYRDHGAGVEIKATSWSLLSIRDSTALECASGGKHATMKGKAIQDKTPPEKDLTVEVDDCGEPGSGATDPDRFKIDVPGYSNGGPLLGGNVQVHKK